MENPATASEVQNTDLLGDAHTVYVGETPVPVVVIIKTKILKRIKNNWKDSLLHKIARFDIQ